MSFNIHNRRYTGSKYKIVNWIRELIIEHCKDATSFFDIFAGTGIVTATMIKDYNEYYINDFLFSNHVIYIAFFSKEEYSYEKIYRYYHKYKNLNSNEIEENYVSMNYGDRYFAREDALKIGFIREDLEQNKNLLNNREFCILLASLIYSFDRCANTVGHYEAYFKGKYIKSSFEYELIDPIIESNDEIIINITREDSNILASKITSDIVYIDPPYSSRQYSRFYHVIENIVKWDKPELFGVAMKPKPENMSEYCSSKALDAFKELIFSLNAKYIVVSYNNTYNSKSKSSENKMALDDILSVLNKKGSTKVFKKEHMAFNAGKTDLQEHMEYVFITKVGGNNE